MHPDPWTVAEAVGWAERALEGTGVENPRLNAQLLVGHVTGMKRLELHVHDDRVLTQEESDRLRECVERRCRREPLQYITGEQEFMGLRFLVNENVLVPRFDTEVLVERVIEELDRHFFREVRVVDIGTGSGAIGLSIAHYFPQASVLLTDVSVEALRVARINRDRLGLEERVSLAALNLCDGLIGAPTWGSIDLVTCNLPYIPEPAFPHLQPEVKDHEPRVALDGGEDGLRLYRALLASVGKGLRSQGLLAAEIGIGQKEAMRRLVESTGDFAKVEVIDDYSHTPRVVLAYRPEYPGLTDDV